MKNSLLLDFYGEILSERRRGIMEMYYNEDFSLSEIAEEYGISRQGVRDSIKKSESELADLEEKLGLVRRFDKIRAETEAIKRDILNLSEGYGDNMRSSLLKISDRLEKLDI